MTDDVHRPDGRAPQHASTGPRIRSTSWLLDTTVSRSLTQWRLISVILGVAILATTLISSLGLLVTATEAGGVRGAFGSMSPAQSSVKVQLVHQFIPIADARAIVIDSTRSLLAPAATAIVTSVASTELDSVPAITALPGLTYFGELDDLASHATLTEGVWATDAAQTGGEVAVTLPASASTVLGFAVGSTFAIRNDPRPVTVRVVGLYRANHPDDPFWAGDVLHGRGNDPAFPLPNVGYFKATDTFGPLIAAPGAIDAAGLRVLSLDMTFRPDFTGATVDQLGPLVTRLAGAGNNVREAVGNGAASVFVTTGLEDSVRGIATGLVVTRSTVVVVSLLLLVLAIVAMGQTARLFTDARAEERQLMRSRGAATAQIVGLAAFEAVIIGVIVATVSPPLASLVYRVLAAQPAMVAAGMPLTAGLPLLVWLTGGGIALVFVAVLLVPLIRRSDADGDGANAKGRERSSTGMMRSGLDLAFVALAGVAYWQLQSYRSPFGDASLAVDPVLVVGPALVLLASALMCVRLIPLASKLVEKVGSRSRGAILPLASWELGRRSRQATSAVLLLSLAVGVGTFGLSFLDTWRQSQVDQSAVAVGAPVRMPSVPGKATTESAGLASGAIGAPQPGLRRAGDIGGSAVGGLSAPSGTGVTAIGLTTASRSMIDRGRSAAAGGTVIARELATPATKSAGVDLPMDARGLAAVVEVTGATPTGRDASLHAIVEDASGLLSTIDLGRVPIDERSHSVRGMLPTPVAGTTTATPLRIVGMQVTVSSSESAVGSAPGSAVDDSLVTIRIGRLGAVTSDPTKPVPVAAPPVHDWYGSNTDRNGKRPVIDAAETDWPVVFDVDVPASVATQPVQVSLVGWDPVSGIPTVLPTAFARRLNVEAGSSLRMIVDGVTLSLLVVGTPSLVPGAAPLDELTAQNTALAASSQSAKVAVVDQGLLARALAQGGVEGPMVDEWWVDVPPGTGQSYLKTHVDLVGCSAQVLGMQLQQSPLRVATQAALWLAIISGALLAAIGFAVHSTTTLRARRLELAQLRAIGLSRNSLVGLITIESVLLSVLGTVFGVGIGLLLVWLVGPLVAVSPGGAPTVPSVMVQIPWPAIALLVAEVGIVLAVLVLVVARVQRFAEPAELLRGGNEP